MATVERRTRKLADGSTGPVHYRVRWRDPDGKQKSQTFPKRKLADDWAVKVEHGMRTGGYIDHIAGRVTVQSYAEEWRSAQAWKPSTAERIESNFRVHLYEAFGDRQIGSLRRAEIKRWLLGLISDGTLGPNSAGVLASTVSMMLATAVDDLVIPANPCLRIKLPKGDRPPVVPLTVAQVQAVAAKIAPEWFAAIAVGAGVGLRSGEVLGLTDDRVNWLGLTIRVDRQAVMLRGAPPGFGPPKTKASSRTIPIAESTSKVLAAHIEQFGLGRDGLIFHQEDGSMWRRQRFSEAVAAARDAVNKAGAEAALGKGVFVPEDMRFHDLRHFYASMLIHQGLSVVAVQRRLGHATASETLDTYSHLWPDDEELTREAVETMVGGLFERSLRAV